MRGEITTYDPTTGTGAIKGHDGALYVYSAQNLHSGSEPYIGQTVEFIPEGSTATHIVDLPGGAGSAHDPAQAYRDGLSSQNDANGSFGASGASIFTAPPVHDTYDIKSAMLSYVGRMRRQHFGISFLIIMGVSMLVGLIPVIGQLISIALIYPWVCITIKRLHDMGRSGWLTLVPVIGSTVGTILVIIGGAGSLVSAASSGSEASVTALGSGAMVLIGALISLITGFGFLIWIAFTNGQPGPNRFGPNPKGQ